MWNFTNIVITPDANSAGFNATITFTSGANSVTMTSRLSSRQELEDTIRVNIARLNERSTLIAQATARTFALTPPPTPPAPTARQIAEREYHEALVVFEDLKRKAELDPTTFNHGLGLQRVIVQQKLATLTTLQ